MTVIAAERILCRFYSRTLTYVEDREKRAILIVPWGSIGSPRMAGTSLSGMPTVREQIRKNANASQLPITPIYRANRYSL